MLCTVRKRDDVQFNSILIIHAFNQLNRTVPFKLPIDIIISQSVTVKRRQSILLNSFHHDIVKDCRIARGQSIMKGYSISFHNIPAS